MKTKYVYMTTAMLCIFVVLVIFKLNGYYKSEKMQALQIQMNQQNISLKTSIATQIGQLKNILSSYSYRIDESKLNWMQIDPLTVIAQTQISKTGFLEVKNIFSKSGTRTERWNKEFLQKALGSKKYSGKSIHADLFQTKAGDKYLALTFAASGGSAAGIDAVTVVGDANYFQKFLDVHRSKKITHLLMTDLNVVAGHSESEYIAALTKEGSLDLKKYFTKTEEMRSSNLKIISYAAQSAIFSFLNIPIMLFGLILGFSCVLIGILFYAFRPIEKTILAQKTAEREQIYQNAIRETTDVMKSDFPMIHNSEISISELKLKPAAVRVEIDVPTMIQPAVAVLPVTHPVVPLQTQQSVQTESTLNFSLSAAIDSIKEKCLPTDVRLDVQISTQNVFEFDQSRFQKMFDQILKNAVEAVETAVDKKIRVYCYDNGFATIVEMSDSGVGVSPENLEKIWQPYFTTKNKNKHSGLGLSEALSVARRYGGDVLISQNSGGGTMVKLIMNQGINAVKEQAETVETVLESNELDIDQILNFDNDDVDTISTQNSNTTDHLKTQFTTTQFKIDRHTQILDDPILDFKKNEKLSDQFQVNIRGPRKS